MDKTRSDEAVSPAEAQNTGPAHKAPPGSQEPARAGREREADPRTEAVPPGGEPEVADDR